MYVRSLDVRSQCATQNQDLDARANHNSFARSDRKIVDQWKTSLEISVVIPDRTDKGQPQSI